VSLVTWNGLLVCASVAFIHAVLVVQDWPLVVSTGCNVVRQALVIAGVPRTRAEHRRRRG
jgi:hypothetical protein